MAAPSTTSIGFSTNQDEVYYVDTSGNLTTLDLSATNGVKVFVDSGKIKAEAATSTPSGTTKSISTTNAQWQITYHPGSNQSFVVGTTDIGIGIKSSMHIFDMNTVTELNIKVNGSNIEIISSTR